MATLTHVAQTEPAYSKAIGRRSDLGQTGGLGTLFGTEHLASGPLWVLQAVSAKHAWPGGGKTLGVYHSSAGRRGDCKRPGPTVFAARITLKITQNFKTTNKYWLLYILPW